MTSLPKNGRRHHILQHLRILILLLIFNLTNSIESHEELNDLRDLDLLKYKAELLCSRLQQWNLLKENVRVSMFCKMYEDLVQFFKMERGLVACTDTDGLMQTLNINHIPLDWRLFTDSSKLSLKAVLLHNGNTLPSIPVGHSVHNKESY